MEKEPKVLKAYKFRIYPMAGQIVQIGKTFGCARFVYNHFLSRRKEEYEGKRETLNFAACCKELAALKAMKDFAWLKDAGHLRTTII